MKPLLSLILLVFTLSTNAQLKHFFGPENVPAKDLRLNEVLGGDVNYFYTHKISTGSKGVTHFIEMIDRKTLKPLSLKELNLKDENFKIELERLLFNDDELVAFVSKKNKKSKSLVFSVITFATSSLTRLKEIQLTSIALKKDVDPKVSVKTNSDNTMALVKIVLPSNNPKDTSTQFAVYDIFESSKLWSKKITDNLKDNGNNDLMIDEDGNVHYVYFSIIGGIPRKETSYDLNYTLITRYLTTKKITLPFGIKGKAGDIKLSILQNKTLSLTGTFIEIDPLKKVGELNSGIFNYVFDYKRSEIVSKKFLSNADLELAGKTSGNATGFKMNYNIDDMMPYGNSCIIIGHKSFCNDSICIAPVNLVAAPDLSEISYLDLFLLKIGQNSEIEYCRNFPFCSKLSNNYYYLDMCDVKQILKQYINTTTADNLYLFHNEDPQSSKHFVCNKISLKDGSAVRSIIDIPQDNAFVPVLEKDHSLAHPFESKIFDKHRNNIYVPIKLNEQKERFLTITLD